MSGQVELIKNFYDAFHQRDWKTMGDCYADNARFHDPVFQELDAVQVRAMWRVLLERAENLEVRLNHIGVEGDRLQAFWEARYVFGKTGRIVHNRVSAHFSFQSGKILTHVDDFDLWRWSAQTLGWTGRLLGWTVFVRSSLRDQAQGQLKRYLSQLRNSPDQIHSGTGF
jgi:ketosteroid isomerase-like protein